MSNNAKEKRNSRIGLAIAELIVSIFIPCNNVFLTLLKIFFLSQAYGSMCVAATWHVMSYALTPQEVSNGVGSTNLLAWIGYYVLLAVYCFLASTHNEYAILAFVVFFVIGIFLRGIAAKVAKLSFQQEL